LKIVVADNEKIQAVHNEWNALVHSMEMPNVFLTWEWVTTWIELFGSSYDVLILLGYEDNKLVCVMPLTRKLMRLEDGFLKQQVVTFCGSLELYPDHLDLICDKGTPQAEINNYLYEFIQFIYNDSCDVLYLPYLAELGYLSRWINEHRLTHRIIEYNGIISPYILFGENISSYFQTMGKKKRYNIKREAKILFEQKNVEMKCLESEDDIKRGLEDLYRLHSARSQARGIESTFSSDRIMNYHLELAKKTASMDWVRIFQLKENSNIIASAYGFLFNDRFNYYQTGFDPGWSSYSPGNVLIYSMIEYLSGKGCREFDFLGGTDAYKLYWTKESRLMKTYLIFNQSLTSRLEYFLQKARIRVKTIIKKSSIISDWLKNFIAKLKNREVKAEE
jgi:hypothetical protein